MEKNIWQYTVPTNVKEQKNAYQVLKSISEELEKDTKGNIEGYVTEVFPSKDGEPVTYALYLIVPKLNNYQYRLIEVVQKNPFIDFPVDITLLDYENSKHIFYKEISREKFEGVLLEIINSELVKHILGKLIQIINTKAA